MRAINSIKGQKDSQKTFILVKKPQKLEKCRDREQFIKVKEKKTLKI